ncbi:MAG: hypothetical protein RBT57_06220 [Paludibacter sp.]|jgi:hypothetical protein|nr:hypothetical protein [Paludibacter sp.]
MKKNIMKIFASLFVVAFAVTACTEEEILKSDYDYVPVPEQLPTVTATLGEVTGASAMMTGAITFNGDTTYFEKGFVCATDVDFKTGVVSKKVAGPQYSGTVDGLKELTNYYGRAYVITKNGIAYSSVVTFSTPMLRNPLTDFFGSYVQSDYLYADEKLEAAYGGVQFVEIPGNIKQLKVVNFWDGGQEIIMDFDLPNKKVSIANTQVIYKHATYGDTKALPYNGTALGNTPLTGTILADGTIRMDSWAAAVSAGTFGRYKYSTLVPATNSIAGVYTEVDYKADGTVEATYKDAIVIAPVAGDLSKITIKNFWDGGGHVIEAVMNFAAGTFTIAPQIIYKDATYGDCRIYPYNVSANTVDKSGAATQGTIKAGVLEVGSWAATVEAGTFGKYSKSTLTKGSAAAIRTSVPPVSVNVSDVKPMQFKSVTLQK